MNRNTAPSDDDNRTVRVAGDSHRPVGKGKDPDPTIVANPEPAATIVASVGDTVRTPQPAGELLDSPARTMIGAKHDLENDHGEAAPPTSTAVADVTDRPHAATATDVTMIPNKATPGADPAATVIGVPVVQKDSEDFYDTLIEDPETRAAGAGTIAGLVIGDYQVMSELGRGGMGVVYKAKHRKLNRIVALKMILAGKHSGGEALQRFIAEARAVAHLQHPGIVQIFDIGEHQALPYFSLEFVEGKDLHRDLNGQPRDARSSAVMVEQLCVAMQYAHDNRILHRDLKPANILLDASGKPKITDFGLAKNVDAEGSGATSDGTIMGSPSYMPPEQARGELSSITPRSDLYSLGAILYQMLTGRPPFITDRPLDTVMQVVNNDPVQPRDLQPGIPVDVETICMKALQKDQAQRYVNCNELAADLRRFLNGEPIHARPVSRLERAWRWCKRNPKVAVPSTVASFFIIATAFISTWAWSETSAQAAIIAKERDTVKEQRDEVRKQKAEVEVQRDEAKRQETIANQQTILAQQKEELAKKQANLALDSMQFLLTDIDKSLSQQPGSTELRIAILEAMSKKWDELDVALTTDGVLGEAIPTHMAMRQLIATAFMEVDRIPQSDAEFSKLHGMAEQRIADKGRLDATRTNLAKIKFAWSAAKRRLDGDPTAAIQLLQEAADLVRETIRDPQKKEGSPSDNEILELLGSIVQNLGVEYLRQGKLPETAAAFQESLDCMARALDNIRSEPGFADLNENQKDGKTANQQISHDKAALGLAYLLVRLGKTEESLAMYDKAIAGRREIFTRRPTMLPLKVELAGHLGNYGNACLWIDQPEKAEPLLRESLQLSEEIWAADPEKADYKRALTTAQYRMATLRDAQGHADEALALSERSRQLRSELAQTSPDEKNRINLMLAEARVGNVEAAELLIDELGKSDKQNGELHLERARALAQLTRRTEGDKQTALRDAALTALERAVTEGYSDPFRVSAEQDLDPLHDTDRFKLIVAGLESARATALNH